MIANRVRFTQAFLTVSLALSIATASRADDVQRVTVASPDGRNTITLELAQQGETGLALAVARHGRPVLTVAGFNVLVNGKGGLADRAKLGDVARNSVDDTFRMPWGKSGLVHHRCQQATAEFTSGQAVGWRLELAAFDDGVAYRYVLPEQSNLHAFTITAERGDVRLAGEPTLHYTVCRRFTTDHESEFLEGPLAELKSKTLVDLPLLAVWPGGQAAAITEALVRDFASLYLEVADHGASRSLATRLSPLPDNSSACVVAETPHASPWRVILLGDRAGTLLESNLLVCLNDPPPAGDYSWARPGKTTWHWWNGTAEKDLPFDCGMNLATHKHYVDFCARHGITYHAVVADDRPWHVQTAADFAPAADTDILTPRPELELPKLLDYARQKGVGIRLWVHWKALDARLEEAFDRYQQWGISGLMVDFLDRDDQQMVEYCDRVLESAARHKLHIQFHGSYKPSGEWRTFPHLFNREGVLNLEYLKWSKRCTPPHNVAAAYVRQLAGPLDYHLGGFHSAPRATFEPQNENPFVLGTRCHHLSTYVVYENPMPQVCDSPSAYEGQPGFEFIVEVPVTWDETRFVGGEAGQYIVLARRRGSKWYLGGMNDWTAREIDVPLAFLAPGAYKTKLFIDGSQDENQPNAIRIAEQSVDRDRSLTIRMAPGGGFAAIVAPQ